MLRKCAGDVLFFAGAATNIRLGFVRSLSCKCDDTSTSKTSKLESLSKLAHHISEYKKDVPAKITVVGTGQVGMATVICLLTQGVTSHLSMVDLSETKLQGEMLDLQHGSMYLRNAKIEASKDYKVSEGSSICIIAAGARQKGGETRLDLLQRNVNIFKEMVPKLLKHSPECILLLATNPVDVVTYVAWRISGLPMNRVIGSGTNLDSARFRYLLSERLNVAPTSVHGFMIGEHGNSCVPVWSGVNVAGIRLRDLNPKVGLDDDPEKWHEVHKEVIASGAKVRTLKGFTSWAIGLSISHLCYAITTNMNAVYAVSTHVKGQMGIKQDVFLSLPCVLGGSGVADILQMQLTPHELKLLHRSADIIAEAQKDLRL